jgi:hypothetical protein
MVTGLSGWSTMWRVQSSVEVSVMIRTTSDRRLASRATGERVERYSQLCFCSVPAEAATVEEAVPERGRYGGGMRMVAVVSE